MKPSCFPPARRRPPAPPARRAARVKPRRARSDGDNTPAVASQGCGFSNAKRTPALTFKRRNAVNLVDNKLEQALQPLIEGASLPLRSETYEKARAAAPGFDVYALEQDWREWIARKGKLPKNPDSAFIGFCRRKAQPKTA